MTERVEWNAEDYSRHSAAQQKWARELIAKLCLRGDERVLDIGSGDGKVSAEIAQQLPSGSVVGIDNSADMVRFAIESFPPEKCPNLLFGPADARELAFNAEFDVVFSNATLHWVVDHRPVLQGIGRALRPGGRMLLQMGGRGNAAQILSLIDDVKDDARWREGLRDFPCPYGFHGPEEYADWLRKAGLHPRRIELIPKDMTQQGKEGLAGWMRTTWMPYIQQVPSQHREAFVQTFVDLYVQRHPPDAAGQVHVKMVRLEVEACKNGK